MDDFFETAKQIASVPPRVRDEIEEAAWELARALERQAEELRKLADDLAGAPQ